MDLKGAVVLVTGASTGIGAATARAAARAGAKTVLVDREEDGVRKLAEELADAIALRCDVTDRGQVADVVRIALDAFGRIDVLINNAGRGLQGSIEELDPEEFLSVLDLNVVAPLITMQAVLPGMRKLGRGSIVNVSSGIVFASLPETARGGYIASKAALSRLSEVARAELADSGIAVSTMYPFITETEFFKTMQAGHQSASRQEPDEAPSPQKPEQVADAILALIVSGADRADMVPERFGGTYKG